MKEVKDEPLFLTVQKLLVPIREIGHSSMQSMSDSFTPNLDTLELQVVRVLLKLTKHE